MELVSESNLECNNHCYSHEEPEEKRSCLTRLWHKCQWRKILTFSSLWVGYFLCNMCFSIVVAFFPDEVRSKLRNPHGYIDHGHKDSCTEKTMHVIYIGTTN